MDHSSRLERWDIFCRVIDNFGDAGVCWRLASDLSSRGLAVRLYIDQPDILIGLMGPLDNKALFSVRRWPEDTLRFSVSDVADVVIEAFACDTPTTYVEAMALVDKPPIWINLEYLSAEDWVEANHRLPSPHPRYALTKYFYFPGFTAGTGGLLREPELLARLSTDTVQLAAMPDPLRIYMFGYHQPAMSTWLDALALQERCTVLMLAPCPLQQQVADWCSLHPAVPQLGIENRSFVPQIEFDLLLAQNDFLFVRGEDSFVRAQWVAKPLVWQIYPQEEDAHLIKLQAFYDRYLNLGILSNEQQSIYWQFVKSWNNAPGFTDGQALLRLWPRLVEIYPLLLENARVWRNQLLKQRDLVSQLRDFVGHLVK